MKIQSYRELEVWKKSMKVVTEVYRITRSFPREELYALTSQLRRAAISIPSNIAEGWGRNSTKEYMQFLRIARGSLLELETQLTISQNLAYLNTSVLQSMLQITAEVNKMINAMINKLGKTKKHS